LIAVAGEVGVGKTSLVSNIAYNVAKAWRGELRADGILDTIQGGIVGYFSLDMSVEQIATRIISSRADVPINSILRGAITESDFDRIATVAREIKSIPLYIDDTGGLSIEHIVARAHRLKRSKGLDLLVVDNLRSIRTAASPEDGEAHVNIVATLKTLAGELDIPIIAVSQLSTLEDEMVGQNLKGLRVDASIDQRADVVMLLFRDDIRLLREEPYMGTLAHAEWVDRLGASLGRAEIIIAKNRHGPTGTIGVEFYPDVARFQDLVG
jgi:replicative DNA helicase